MNSQRLKQLRLSRGFSLDALAAELGGIVTKQALSKYEQGKMVPTPRVLAQLASTLGVKAAHLFTEPGLEVQFIAYRKASRLAKKEQERIKGWVSQTLEERVWLQQLISSQTKSQLPIQKFSVATLEDVETVAEDLRDQWQLGRDSIASVTRTLEDNFVHVLEVDAADGFDGISAVAYESLDQVVAAVAVTRKNISGERQRLNLTHELGHLVLNIPADLDEEKAAFRFGAAFLAPRAILFQEVGYKRTNILFEELELLKQRLGLSLQAILYRLKDLNIINASYHREWCITINKLGWRRQEPGEFPPEPSQWLRQNVLHALSEKMITHLKAEELLKEVLPMPESESLATIERRTFLRLPLQERSRILAAQADQQMVEYYNQNQEWQAEQGGDFIDA
jgi:Zn-dependent peptidase ImmA (M78 family)/DNA-binding XRE family transcriptional regulator